MRPIILAAVLILTGPGLYLGASQLQQPEPTIVTLKALPGTVLRCIIRTYSGNLTIDRRVLHITVPIAEVFPSQGDTLLVPQSRGELTCTSQPTSGQIGESPYGPAGR